MLQKITCPAGGARRQLYWWAALIMATAAVQAAPASDQHQGLALSAQASLRAREQCQALMHEDSDPFTQCVDRLLVGPVVRDVKQRYARLGVAYYAWLASASASKNAMPHASAAAEHFVLIFRPLQRQLKISDEALCKTIEGDCVSRNARMLIIELEALARQPKQAKTPGHKPLVK